MAEIENIPNKSRAQRGKLVLKDMGEGAMVKTMTDEAYRAAGNKYVTGYLLGRARGFVERTDDKTGQKFEGLLGTFRMMPVDKSLEELESGVLFIPDAFHNLIADRIREAKKNNPNDENIVVDFAFEVSSVRAKNPAGYSWQFLPTMEPDAKDPLGHLSSSVHKLIAATTAKQIAAPKSK